MQRLFFPVTKREAERQGIPFSSSENKNALFPSQLRELREEKGISQAVLATALGVSKSTIGLWETGDTLPDARSLHDIATYFEVSADYLLGLSKARQREHHSFAEQTHFRQETILNLLCLSHGGKDESCFKRNRISFEYLLNANEFSEILSFLRDYLDVTALPDKTVPLADLYIKLDTLVNDVSKGNFHVVSSTLFSKTVITRAQQKLAELFEQVEKQIRKNGGWEQYMP